MIDYTDEWEKYHDGSKGVCVRGKIGDDSHTSNYYYHVNDDSWNAFERLEREFNKCKQLNSHNEQSISTSTSTLPPIIVNDNSEFRRKRGVVFDKNILDFDNSTINPTIPNLDISAINSMDYQNQSVANVSSTNIPTI